MALVIIPQAMPAIVPPMISQWMNTVKNSSLAIAIGYADIVSLFMQTGLNQAGHAVGNGRHDHGFLYVYQLVYLLAIEHLQ